MNTALSSGPDPRAPVLQLLRTYAAATADAAQRQLAVGMIEFVTAHANCLERACVPGHLTGSAWIVSPDRSRVLLTHHRKLGLWLQLGGHADGESDLLAVAEREAREESGLTRLRVARSGIFDCDCHLIPARATDPAHYHYDLRFLFEADPDEPLILTAESKELAWVELGRVATLNPEASIARMVARTPAVA